MEQLVVCRRQSGVFCSHRRRQLFPDNGNTAHHLFLIPDDLHRSGSQRQFLVLLKRAERQIFLLEQFIDQPHHFFLRQLFDNAVGGQPIQPHPQQAFLFAADQHIGGHGAAQMITAFLRPIDTGDDLLCRHGGILFPVVGETAGTVAAALRCMVTEIA